MHQWKKVHTGYIKGPSGRARKRYKYVSDDGKLEIFPTTEHPTMGFAHQKKQIYWKVFDLVNQQPYGPPRRNLEDAFVAAKKWYEYIDVKESIMFGRLFEQIEATKLADKILETYKRIAPDESFTTVGGSINTPVATLVDEYGGRAQIGVDDHCYVLYLLQENGRYKRTAWVFSEAHGVLKDLPDPSADITEKCEPEDGIKDFEYLLHHIITDDKGKEEIHHCLVYDHVGNMFEQGHLVVKDGKVTLNGKKIKDGTFHVLTGLEPSQEVVWGDDTAKENNITVKKMEAGMSLKDKSKVW